MKRWSSLINSVRTHISMKLGLLLFSVFLLIIFSIGNILYSLFLSFYVSHVTEELIQRAHSHASVLSDRFTKITMDHVVRMEKGSKFRVVILGTNGEVLVSSETVTPVYQQYLDKVPKAGEQAEGLLEADWQGHPFLVGESPILQGEKRVGAVVIFSPTQPIREAVSILQVMLFGIGLITLFIVAGILFVISRMITTPLLDMKKATEEIARGRYVAHLPVHGEDEVAQLAASINYMAQEIQFYQKQRNEFLADIGHELKTPLTYLKGYSEILQRHTLSEEEKRSYLQIIGEQSTRLQRLVQDLFDLARMEQGNFRLEWQRLSLEDVVTHVLSLVEPSMDQKGILLDYEGPGQEVFVRGDQQRLQQVFINLLENARRYTPPDGRVYVRLEKGEQEAVVAIQDTGPGIPQEELPFIMERLYRVEKSRSQETGGAGLGLAISKKLMEMHHGSIMVESEEGKGTVFYVRIPIANFEWKE